jgi:hypothetical protein
VAKVRIFLSVLNSMSRSSPILVRHMRSTLPEGRAVSLPITRSGPDSSYSSMGSRSGFSLRFLGRLRQSLDPRESVLHFTSKDYFSAHATLSYDFFSSLLQWKILRNTTPDMDIVRETVSILDQGCLKLVKWFGWLPCCPLSTSVVPPVVIFLLSNSINLHDSPWDHELSGAFFSLPF